METSRRFSVTTYTITEYMWFTAKSKTNQNFTFRSFLSHICVFRHHPTYTFRIWFHLYRIDGWCELKHIYTQLLEFFTHLFVVGGVHKQYELQKKCGIYWKICETSSAFSNMIIKSNPDRTSKKNRIAIKNVLSMILIRSPNLKHKISQLVIMITFSRG